MASRKENYFTLQNRWEKLDFQSHLVKESIGQMRSTLKLCEEVKRGGESYENGPGGWKKIAEHEQFRPAEITETFLKA